MTIINVDSCFTVSLFWSSDHDRSLFMGEAWCVWIGRALPDLTVAASRLNPTAVDNAVL